MHNPPGFVQGLCRIERVVQEFGVVQEFALRLARRQGAADLIAPRIPPSPLGCLDPLRIGGKITRIGRIGRIGKKNLCIFVEFQGF